MRIACQIAATTETIHMLLILSPNQPETGCGLGDFSAIVRNDLGNVDIEIVSQNTNTNLKPTLFLQLKFVFRILNLVRISKIKVILLNYSAWGYERHGLPFHIVALALLLRLQKPHLVTFFHELWASSYSPRQSFISRVTDRLQQKCIWMIAVASGDVVTSTSEKAGELAKIVSHPIFVVPVPSNIRLQSAHRPARREEKFSVLLFGRPNTRAVALNQNVAFLLALRDLKLLGSVHVVGQNSLADVDHLQSIGISKDIVRAHGFLSNEHVSGVLSVVDFFLSPYSRKDIGKSGTLQAALAHGVIPILAPTLTEKSFCPIDGVEFQVNSEFSRADAERARDRLTQCLSTQDQAPAFKTLLRILNSWRDA